MRTAILYICTGKYTQFFEGFYESAEKFLLKGTEKHYFVWTDDDQLTKAPNVTLIHREYQGFPMDSLMRFDMFLSIANELKTYDYAFFLNSNALLIKEVGQEILPDEEQDICAARWMRQKPLPIPMFFPYERNKQSAAYVKPFDGPYNYYMGGFNGGKTAAYLAMAEQSAEAIRQDLGKGIIAQYHDQSHLNKYLHKHPCKELPKGYCCPEEWLSDSYETHIIFRNKVAIDSSYDKSNGHAPADRIKKALQVLWHAIKWYI